MMPASRPSTTRRSTRPDDTSRLSIHSELAPAASKYPRCEAKKTHAKQILNLVCVSENCRSRGPICAMCRTSEHSGHVVMPVRKFLEQVQSCLGAGEKREPVVLGIGVAEGGEGKVEEVVEGVVDKPEGDVEVERGMQAIEKCRDEMLYTLSLHVQAIAQKIREVECCIYSTAQKALQKLQSFSTMESNIGTILEQLQMEGKVEPSTFRGRIQDLLNCLKCKSKGQFEINKQNSIKIVREVQKMGENFKAGIGRYYIESIRLLQGVFNEQQKQPPKQLKAGSAKFSAESRIKSIEVSAQQKAARLADNQPGFAIVSGLGPIKQKTLRLKIHKMHKCIMLGVCLSNVVKNNAYKIPNNLNALNNGIFVTTNQAQLYSHNSKEQNGAAKGLNFLTNDIVTLAVKNDTLVVTTTSSNASATIYLKKLGEGEWKNLAFCVGLQGVDDRVELVQ